MPYKSDAQRRKFHALAKEGKISQDTVSEYDKASKGMKLPERIGPMKKMPSMPKMPKIKSLDQLRTLAKKMK